MALVSFIGIETNDLTEFASITGSPSRDGTAKTGDSSVLIDTTGGAAVTFVNFTTGSIYTKAFHVRVDTAPNINAVIVGDNTISTCYLVLTTDRYLKLYDGNDDLIGTSTTQLATDGTWYYICFAGDSSQNGDVKLFINGSEEISGTVGAVEFASMYNNFGTFNSTTIKIRFDNIVTSNDTDLSCLDESFVLRLDVNADGTNTDFEFDEGGAITRPGYDSVNEVPADADGTSHVYGDGDANEEETFQHETCVSAGVGASDTVEAMNFLCWMKRGGGKGSTHQFVEYDTTNTETSKTLDTSYSLETQFRASPATSGAWSQAVANAYELGAGNLGNGGQETYLENVMFMVLYKEAGVTNYDRSASVAIGCLVSADRTLAFDRDAAVLLGVLVSAARGWGRAISSSILVGVLVSATRLPNYVKSASVLIGVLVTAARAIAATRSATVIVGVLVSAVRLWATTKSGTVIIGVLVSATRILGKSASAAVLIGVLVAATISAAFTRSAAVLIGVLVSADRILAATRTASVIVGVLVSATRVLGKNVTCSVLIGVLVTASKLWAAVRTASVIIGNLVTADRILAATRSAIVLIGVLVSADRSKAVTRTASVLFGVLVSATKLVNLTRSASVLIGFLVSATKIVNIIKTASVQIGVLVSADRILAAIRSASVAIGVLVSASKLRNIIKTASVVIGVLVSASKIFSGGATVSATVVIGVKVTAHWCAWITTRLRMATSALDVSRLGISRMSIQRRVVSRLPLVRRIWRCDE